MTCMHWVRLIKWVDLMNVLYNLSELLHQSFIAARLWSSTSHRCKRTQPGLKLILWNDFCRKFIFWINSFVTIGSQKWSWAIRLDKLFFQNIPNKIGAGLVLKRPTFQNSLHKTLFFYHFSNIFLNFDFWSIIDSHPPNFSRIKRRKRGRRRKKIPIKISSEHTETFRMQFYLYKERCELEEKTSNSHFPVLYTFFVEYLAMLFKHFLTLYNIKM